MPSNLQPTARYLLPAARDVILDDGHLATPERAKAQSVRASKPAASTSKLLGKVAIATGIGAAFYAASRIPKTEAQGVNFPNPMTLAARMAEDVRNDFFIKMAMFGCMPCYSTDTQIRAWCAVAAAAGGAAAKVNGWVNGIYIVNGASALTCINSVDWVRATCRNSGC